MMACQCRYSPLKWHIFISKATHDYPHALKKKQRGYCNSLRPSVMPSPRKPLANSTKFGAGVTHIIVACNGACFLAPTHWGPGEGSTCQMTFNFNYKVNFKDVYNKRCVCSHKWKIQSKKVSKKHIRWDWSCPRGGTLGRWGCPGVDFFQRWSRGISNRHGWRAKQNASKMLILKSNWCPWGELKTSTIIKFRLPCQFQT